MASRTQRIMAATITPVLLTGGIALAASNSGNDSGATQGQKQKGQQGQQDRRGPRDGRFGPGHGPHRGPIPRNLTYGELHVWRNGKDVVIRIDKGKVKSASATEITVTELSGQDVTIPVDGSTKVRSGPPWAPKTVKVQDLKAGTEVVVRREGDGAAKEIMVLPKKGERPPRPPMGGPQGGQGGQQGNAPSGQYGPPAGGTGESL